ncbi:MAG: ChaN family lipoprotein [Flavobacteriales bacterium]|nr:ChaN family lipoprotein [Flavobacteriales bacterium]
MKRIVGLAFIISSLVSIAQDKAFIIYNAKGKKVSYKKMIKSLNESDITLFGELHNNPISHWLQLEVTNSLGEKRNLILAAEMFERDNQNALNDYLSGKIDEKGLDSLARLWNNFETDYKPLVDYAKQHKLQFVAANIPRRYASMVYKGDFKALDSLPANEKEWIAKLPIAYDKNLPGYQKMLEMMGGHGGETFPKAQAIKDATMAESIYKAYEAASEKDKLTVIHYNGAYHSDNYEGILWYLKRKNINLNYQTITTVSQENIKKLLEENIGKADFIICVDEDMTTTY